MLEIKLVTEESIYESSGLKLTRLSNESGLCLPLPNDGEFKWNISREAAMQLMCYLGKVILEDSPE